MRRAWAARAPRNSKDRWVVRWKVGDVPRSWRREVRARVEGERVWDGNWEWRIAVAGGRVG